MKDFFISYNKADRAWAVWIAWQLEQAGYSVVIQAWDFRPGSNFVLEMDKASQEAHRTIAVLSPDYLEAHFTRAEWADAFRRDPTGEQGILVPVRVQPCYLRGLLSSIVYIDLVGHNEMSAREILLQGIQSGRAKPIKPPTFPGKSQQPPFPGTQRPPAAASPNTTFPGSEREAHHPDHESTVAFHNGKPTDFVIITALQEELEALLEKLPSPRRLPPTEEDVRVYYQVDLPITLSDGITGAYRLVLLSLLGMGRVQAANAAADATRRWHPRHVLLVGIAGGIAEAGVQRGDVLIADQVVDYELQKLTVGGDQIRWEAYRADPRLLEASRHQGKGWLRLIKKRRPRPGTPQCFTGPVATGDKVVALKDVLERYRSDWPKLIGIEMEAGGLASAAFQSPWQPGFLMIRGASDLADEHKDDSWRRYACHAAAAYTLELLQSGPVTLSKQEEGGQREKDADLGMTCERDQGSITEGGMPPHPARRHDTYQLISLPLHFMERSQIAAEVRGALFNETSPIALTSATMTTPAALHGMGGIGKTSVARALCDDPAVQQTFPDGILWATLGQKPDLVNQLRLWIQALGGAVAESAPAIESLRLVLTQLLQERSCLLILDDVWSYEDAEQFRLGGPRCRLLLTTRQAEIAHRLGARIQSIPPLPPDDAITLLEAWARGHLASIERSVKEQIVKRLGYLPLAIRLAGPQLIQIPPQEWLQTFDVRDLKLTTRRVVTTHDSLEVTFDLSLEMLQADELRLYLSLAIFPEDEAIPRAVIEHLWWGLGGLSAGKTALLLADLAQGALLEPAAGESTLVVRLHDLLRDLMRIRLGEDGLVVAHRALLEAYRRANDGRAWHAAANDGYLYDHLAYHLRAAGSLHELKGLFANQDWLRARVARHDHTYDGYLADLALALEQASSEAGKQIEAGQAPESLAACIRYTLIRTSINSLAENSIPEMIARAVQVGLWTADQAMSTASRIPQAEQQANTYLLLLETEQLSARQREKALRAAVDYALDVWDEDAKSRMLTRLAPHLTGDLFERVVAAIGSMTDRFAYARVAVALGPKLAGERGTEILTTTLDAIVARIDDIEGRDLFTALVRLLPEELLARASHAILENTHRLYRSQTLAAVAPRLTGKLLEQACEEALALPEAWERAECLRALASQLTESLLARALQAALAVENDWARSHMIAALAPRLEGAPLQQALENVLTIADDRPRDWALTALAAQCELTGESLDLARQAAYDLLRKGLLWPALLFACQGQFEQRDQVMREIFEAFVAEKYRWSMVEQLRFLAPELSEDQLEEVVTVTLQEEDGLIGPSLLEIVVPFLTNGLVQRALETTLREQKEKSLPYTLSALAPRLSESQLEQALRVVLNVGEKRTRLRTLEELAPSLSDQQRDRALTEALELVLSAETTDERTMVGAFVTLAPHLKGEPLKRAWEATEKIKDEWARRRMLASLVPQMSGELLGQALQAALAARAEEAYLPTLSVLAPRLEDEQRRQTLTHVLEATLTMTDPRERAGLLTLLAPRLTGEQRDQALINAFQAVLELPKEWHRAQLLVALVPSLPGSLRDEAVASTRENVQELRNERLQAMILERLIPHLNDDELAQVRRFVAGLQDRLARTQVSVALVPRLPSEEHDEIHTKVLTSILEEREGQLRARLLVMLAPQLSEEPRAQALSQILELARLIETEQTRTEILVNVIPLLSDKEQQAALQDVLTISNALVLRWALLMLAPQLNGKAREQAIETAMGFKEEWFRAEILAAFLPAVSDQTLFLNLIRKAMVDVLPQLQRGSLQGVIQNYLGHHVFTTPILSATTLGAIVSDMIEICQEWQW